MLIRSDMSGMSFLCRLRASVETFPMSWTFPAAEVLKRLLSRGYQVVAKISHNGPLHTLRQHIGPWQPTRLALRLTFPDGRETSLPRSARVPWMR
jgi:hypothetical protein